eukprot:TRINITY_DN1830_c0_g1_i1.p1 TRINITY_DN1830_c0_g1~~TRINITY_DN1830_c0_g1_i1.p1  ORF type:complete len:546 (-),score=104.10 TRINITY_DN1830_c0_g1_i1:931-2403(-)
MKWRLLEGHGEALYEIGVEDDGYPLGLSDYDMDCSIANLFSMADGLNCEASIVCERKGKHGKIAEVLVREIRSDEYIDVRISVAGGVDSGKSTLVGVLTECDLDDGHGLARLSCFNHQHELNTGRTSSLGIQILGFDSKGKCVNDTSLYDMDWGDIIEDSYKVISFYDLPGHQKYIKTIVSGMTSCIPDYCFILVGANMEITSETHEHLKLATALKLPIIIILTKVDIAPHEVIENKLNILYEVLGRYGLDKWSIVGEEETLMFVVKDIDTVVPIFMVSNVTGQGIDILKKFLNVLPSRLNWDDTGTSKFLIVKTFDVPDVGTVVGGTVINGSIGIDTPLYLGPESGQVNFNSVEVKNIHSNRIPVRVVKAGQSATFALKDIAREDVRKGMILTTDPELTGSWKFEAVLTILQNSNEIRTNYQPVVQGISIRQCAAIEVILGKKNYLQKGDTATVRFRFLYKPEYIEEGMKIIIRENQLKGIGAITKVLE